MITIEAVVYGLDNCVRGGRLVSHEVVRVLDGLGFPYDPAMRAFYLDNRSVHMNAVDKAREEARMYATENQSRDRLDVAHDRMRIEADPFETKVDPNMYRPSNGPLPGRAIGTSGGGESAGSGCSRMAAREVLRQRAYELRRKAQQLDSLASAIPDNFPADAETALWDLALSLHTF